MTPSRIVILLFASLAANAQAPAPAPAPLPAIPPLAPEPPQPPVQLDPDLPPFDFNFDFGPVLQDQLAQIRVNADQIRAQVADQLAQVRVNADQIRAQADQFRYRFSPAGPRRGDEGLYNSGQRALDRGQWDEALADFNRVVSNAGPRAEGALYWKAYTLNKLGRRDEARAAIADLRKQYANSRWLNDASALDMEIQQAAGQNVSPESQPDEELKLMALNALVHSDPDRALPLLENLLKSAQPPRVKERALFVLSQTEAPRAQQILDQVARGGGNPDLQVTAINYLGATARRKGNTQPLYDIYTGTNDANVKRAILRALRMAGDTDHILQAVKAEKSAELRAEGIRLLSGKADTGDALAALWPGEQDQQVKYAILDALTSDRNAKALVDLARKERDPQMKKEIVRRLSGMESKEATDYLMELLK
jgi:hypothetical protein